MTIDQISPSVEKDISVFVPSQFPAVYRSLGPLYVQFVQDYYSWMQQANGGPTYTSRRILDYADIDATPDEFVIRFKNKYLPDVHAQTNSNVRLLVKRSLDFLRARGTPRAIDLLFRLVFGVGTQVYYPSRDLFRLSDGKWIVPEYLELALGADPTLIINRQVVGLRSRAIAFVERVVKTRRGSKFILVAYISARTGDFLTGEPINLTGSPLPIAECPIIVGSLSSVEVTKGGANFSVGDVVELDSADGSGGFGRISNVASSTGVVTFTLEDGGYAYTVNSAVIVSDSILTLANVQPDVVTNRTEDYFFPFETIRQSQANIAYAAASGSFANNNSVYTYFANNSQKGVGLVLQVNPSNSTAGFLSVTVQSGNLVDNNIYTTANAVHANQTSYVDLTATGNAVSQGSRVTLTVGPVTGAFLVGEQVSQFATDRDPVITGTVEHLSSGVMTVDPAIGKWAAGSVVTGGVSMATANVLAVQATVGITVISGVFLTDTRALAISLGSNTVGGVFARSSGSGATFHLSSNLLYTETVSLNNDLVAPYLGDALNATWPFPAFPTSNLATLIATSLSHVNVVIGKVSSLTSLTPGSSYTAAPYVRIYEPFTEPYKKVGWQVAYTGASAAFAGGEEVTQSATGARGIVQSSNSTSLELRRLSFFKDFVATVNSTTTILGVSSGATANVANVDIDQTVRLLDLGQQWVGFDADVQANSVVANGVAVSLDVIDSGFGYSNGDALSFVSSNGDLATATAIVEHQGHGEGYYFRKGGWPSDQKKLFDGYYWQELSYEVRSSISPDKYWDMLQDILHLSGTQAFGSFWLSAKANTRITSTSSITSTG